MCEITFNIWGETAEGERTGCEYPAVFNLRIVESLEDSSTPKPTFPTLPPIVEENLLVTVILGSATLIFVGIYLNRKRRH